MSGSCSWCGTPNTHGSHAAGCSRPSAPLRQSGWLIEHESRWWSPWLGMTDSADKAVRFAREEDAKAVKLALGHRLPVGCRVTEHIRCELPSSEKSA